LLGNFYYISSPVPFHIKATQVKGTSKVPCTDHVSNLPLHRPHPETILKNSVISAALWYALVPQ